ncbi:MAG TPA: NAD-dependent epimerase/dehydratase family protein [Thermoanaerobaculia bacterium]|nr:NAD-dependent epimerase/dehydratase family protein [Thermoanaerobaculia bacterium]
MAAPRAKRRRRSGKVVDFTPSPSRTPRRTRIAITGGAGLLGSRLVRALAARGGADVLVLDLAPASDMPRDVAHRFLNLNLPFADGTLLKILNEERPDVLVHLAALRSPSRDVVYAHELNSLGALHVLAAAGEAGVPRVVMGSTTLVYGARGDNPNYLTEAHALRPDPRDAFVRDFVEAEQFAKDHARRYPQSKVAVLRFVPLLAPELRDYRSKMFAAPAVVSLLGYDPLVQALHVDDAMKALLLALEKPDLEGVFNVAPDGVLPLSTVYLLFGTLPVPVPHPAAYALIEAAWLAGIGVMPGVHAHYFRYLCLADNAKAKRVLGFAPEHTTLDVVLATAKARRGRHRLLDWDALEETAKRAAFRLQADLGRGNVPSTPPRTRPAETGARRLSKVS